MRPESRALLWDVREAAMQIAEFIRDLDESEYRRDALRKSAVERQLEIVGEALKRLRDLDPHTAASIAELHRIVGLRNILAHGYATVDDGIVWSAAVHRAPELLAIVDVLLGENDASGGTQ